MEWLSGSANSDPVNERCAYPSLPFGCNNSLRFWSIVTVPNPPPALKRKWNGICYSHNLKCEVVPFFACWNSLQ